MPLRLLSTYRARGVLMVRLVGWGVPGSTWVHTDDGLVFDQVLVYVEFE